MSQEEIIKRLSKMKGWISTRELELKCSMNRSNLSKGLRKLIKQGDIVAREFRFNNNKNWGYKYKYRG